MLSVAGASGVMSVVAGLPSHDQAKRWRRDIVLGIVQGTLQRSDRCRRLGTGKSSDVAAAGFCAATWVAGLAWLEALSGDTAGASSRALSLLINRPLQLARSREDAATLHRGCTRGTEGREMLVMAAARGCLSGTI